jgi:hypothetical protein
MENTSQVIGQLLHHIAGFVERNSGITPDAIAATLDNLAEVVRADPDAARILMKMGAAAFDAAMAEKEGRGGATVRKFGRA